MPSKGSCKEPPCCCGKCTQILNPRDCECCQCVPRAVCVGFSGCGPSCQGYVTWNNGYSGTLICQDLEIDFSLTMERDDVPPGTGTVAGCYWVLSSNCLGLTGANRLRKPITQSICHELNLEFDIDPSSCGGGAGTGTGTGTSCAGGQLTFTHYKYLRVYCTFCGDVVGEQPGSISEPGVCECVCECLCISIQDGSVEPPCRCSFVVCRDEVTADGAKASWTGSCQMAGCASPPPEPTTVTVSLVKVPGGCEIRLGGGPFGPADNVAASCPDLAGGWLFGPGTEPDRKFIAFGCRRCQDCLEHFECGGPCQFEWSGTDWFQNSACAPPCNCEEPSEPGSFPGEARLVDCTTFEEVE